MTEVPALQTIQLNADGPLDNEVTSQLRGAVRRARQGGVTTLFDGDEPIAEIVPVLKLVHGETIALDEATRTRIREELDAIDGVSPLRRSLLSEMGDLLNAHGAENGSNTPDFVLATYLARCLDVFDEITQARDQWYSVHLEPGDSYFTNSHDPELAHELYQAIPRFVENHFPKNDTAAHGGAPTPGRGEAAVLLARFVSEITHTQPPEEKHE